MNPPEPVNIACPNCAGQRAFSERLMAALENAQKLQAEALLRAFGIQQEEKTRIYDRDHARSVELERRQRYLQMLLDSYGIHREADGGYIDTANGIVYASADEVIEHLRGQLPEPPPPPPERPNGEGS